MEKKLTAVAAEIPCRNCIATSSWASSWRSRFTVFASPVATAPGAATPRFRFFRLNFFRFFLVCTTEIFVRNGWC
jgi:hypothetical protein